MAFKTVSEITIAIDNGLPVRWQSSVYHCINDKAGYLIKCTLNGHYIGLTWMDGKTLNGNIADFYIAENPKQ